MTLGVFLNCCCSNSDGTTSHPVNVVSAEDKEDTWCGNAILQKAARDKYFQFTVDLDRSSGKKLGIGVRQNPLNSLLQVASVDEGDDSAVGSWNKMHGNSRITENDFIYEVNCQRTVGAMINECKRLQILHVTVQRMSMWITLMLSSLLVACSWVPTWRPI